MPKPAKSHEATATAKPRGGNARARELAAQGHVPNPNMQVPHRPMDAQRKAKFLDYLQQVGSFAEAAQLTDGFNSAAAYRRAAQSDSRFREACDAAIETFGSRILAVLRDEVINGQTTFVTGAGQVILHPETGKPLTVTKKDPKLILAYARRFDRALSDVKIQVSVDGTPAPDANDVRIQLQPSDFWRLGPHETQTLLELVRKIYMHRQEDLGPIKNITPSNQIEDATFSEVEAPEDMANPVDPWELEESDNEQ